MTLSKHHPLQAYWDLAIVPLQTSALAAALELELFDALSTPHSAAELAAAQDLHAPHTALLLEQLWSMQLLERDLATEPAGADTPRYHCSATALHYFCCDSSAFCGDAWLQRLHAPRHCGTQSTGKNGSRGRREHRSQMSH